MAERISICLHHNDGSQKVEARAIAEELHKHLGVRLHGGFPQPPQGHINVNGYVPAGQVDIKRYTNDPNGGDCPDCGCHFEVEHECEVCAECGDAAPKDQPHGPCVSVYLYDGHGLSTGQKAQLLALVQSHKP